ncbi:hypothetical protein FM109_09825 [Vibrio casei]|nr:hypothetical protein FM109_09825 [Vibrio casei]
MWALVDDNQNSLFSLLKSEGKFGINELSDQTAINKNSFELV